MVTNEQILQQIPGLFSIVNQYSQIIYTNQLAAKAYGYSCMKKSLGTTIYDLKSPAAKFAEEIIKQDKKVIRNDTKLLILDIHLYPDGTERILLSQKSPYKIENKTLGCIFHATEIDTNTVSNISKYLIHSDQQFYSKQNWNGRSYIIGDTLNECIFSNRQMDCLFYLLRGHSAKQIAEKLRISFRTVEQHIENMKSIISCNKKSDLIEFAIAKGFIHYVPKHIVYPNSTVLKA